MLRDAHRDDRPCPRHQCASVIEKMQDDDVKSFNLRASYDGNKNLFSTLQIADGTVRSLYARDNLLNLRMRGLREVQPFVNAW